MKTVFIDGSAGTTGLRLAQRLAGRQDISLLTLPEEERKDPAARRDALKSADIAFLCLPDDAAREAVALLGDADTALIDTSTAHRTAPGWDYGMPEMPGQREKLAVSRRIANPGCHASGFIALAAPLVRSGLISRDALLTVFSLTGYTGGGKKMIAAYEAPDRDPLLDAPRQYGLTQLHKHLPEMAALTGLTHPPIFSPIVAAFPCGMEVTIPLFREQLTGGREEILSVYRDAYPGPMIYTADSADESGFLSAGALAGRDDMEITVHGNEDRILVTARFDNLGKGASGAAIQNMNILLGVPETTGLAIKEALTC